MRRLQYIILGHLCIITMQIISHGFVADTPIYTASGTPKPIKKICWHVVNRKKQYVSSFDDKKLQWQPAQVRSVAHAHINCAITLQFDDNPHHDIICSPSQSFYQAHTNEWVPAYKIRAGDLLLTDANRTVHVAAISYQKHPTVVYLLEVKKTHTFCVGHYQLLTHNTPLAIPMACALLLNISGSFGSGAAAGATAGSFFGPITCAGGLVIGGLIGIGASCLMIGPKIRRYDMLFNMQEIENGLQGGLLDTRNGNQHNHSTNKQTGPAGGNTGNDPEDDNNRKGSIENMAKFFQMSKFGKDIKDKIEKTKKIQQGQSVYKVIEDIPKYSLKKGDQFYLDARHKNHFEVFRHNGKAKTVLNLDGTENITKALAANNRVLK